MKNEFFLHYEKEVQYQKHMLDNLSRWFTLLFVIASIGVVLIYFFHQQLFPLLFLGVILLILGVVGMLLFGYGIYKGRANLNKIVNLVEIELSHK